MFYIIGIGLNTKQITLEALEIIKNCGEIYIDNYTNKFSSGQVNDLEELVSKKIKLLNRSELEQDMYYIKDNSILLVIGSPLSATTHYTIIQEAKKRKIKTKIIQGISIFNYKAVNGLFEYKFGKTTSIVYHTSNYKPTSFYNTIIDNLKINAHTLCLLDIKIQENKLMNVVDACKILEDIDNNKEKVLENKDCVLFAAMGSNNSQIITFKFKEYNNIKCELYPQSLIICAQLNDFEKVAIDEYRL
jgi:diphthine synthase